MGFPSPADDYLDPRLRLDDLIVHPEATFYVRVSTLAMLPTLHPRDILIVDRAITPLDGQMAVISYQERLRVRRIYIDEPHIRLVADNRRYREVLLKTEQYAVWGVVITIIRQVDRPR
jgi:DNA polymerase V